MGISGVALNRFKSFLTNRTQRVKAGETYSDIADLLYGIAQGSILGPQLFNICIGSLYKYVEPFKFYGN